MLQGGKILPQAGIASQNLLQLSIFGLCHTACSRPTKLQPLNEWPVPGHSVLLEHSKLRHSLAVSNYNNNNK